MFLHADSLEEIALIQVDGALARMGRRLRRQRLEPDDIDVDVGAM
jgi:hypothetical protein